jgi:hypothetical protein
VLRIVLIVILGIIGTRVWAVPNLDWTAQHLTADGTAITPSMAVTIQGGLLELRTQGYHSGIALVSVLTTVDLPGPMWGLSFDARFLKAFDDVAGDNQYPFEFPDFLIARWGPAHAPESGEGFFAMDRGGAYDPKTMDSLWQIQPLEDGWVRFSQNSGPWNEGPGLLRFDLSDQDDRQGSAAWIRNVSFAIIPEPSVLGLCLAGLFFLGARQVRTNGKRPPSRRRSAAVNQSVLQEVPR